MKIITLEDQLQQFSDVFKNTATSLTQLPFKVTRPEKNCVPLLVIPPIWLNTKAVFENIDLGCMEKNTWFLDSKHMYDIVRDIPNTPYVLLNVNISWNTLYPPNYSSYSFNAPRPLTFHETVTLAFLFPSIFNEKIFGMQAYGSRFANSKSDIRNADTDDTLEIYRKGNPGSGLLKLAREHHRYHEETKIIPFVQ